MFEIFIVALVGFAVLKEEDIKFVVLFISKIYSYFDELKILVLEHFVINKDEIEFYLSKIISMNGFYEGEYKLNSIKAYYYKLLKDRVEKS